jgi:hypothetical protein
LPALPLITPLKYFFAWTNLLARAKTVDKKNLEIDKAILGLVLLTKLLWQINRSMKKITYSLPLGYRTAVSIRRLLNLITEKKSSKP